MRPRAGAQLDARAGALLRDAAHPMLQYMAQGACMATEDAVRLADEVAATPDDIAGALHRHAEARYLRTAKVQITARIYGEFYHARGRPCAGAAARYGNAGAVNLGTLATPASAASRPTCGPLPRR